MYASPTVPPIAVVLMDALGRAPAPRDKRVVIKLVLHAYLTALPVYAAPQITAAASVVAPQGMCAKVGHALQTIALGLGGQPLRSSGRGKIHGDRQILLFTFR